MFRTRKEKMTREWEQYAIKSGKGESLMRYQNRSIPPSMIDDVVARTK